MEQQPRTVDTSVPAHDAGEQIKELVRTAIEEYVTVERRQTEPAYKTELIEERRRREVLERRVNELVAENQRSRQAAEESERAAQVRAELQRLGVAKVDLAFKVVKDEIVRSDDGSLVARTGEGEQPAREFLATFVQENPEFLPARIAGGSGATSGPKGSRGALAGDLERIQPGMSLEELERVRDEVSQALLRNLRGE
jgi:hypothetical protein